MADVHFVGGEKGGVGKSFVTRVLAQYHLDRQIPFTLIEADKIHADVRRHYGDQVECRTALFSEDANSTHTVGKVYDLALTHRVIVNLPAQADSLVHRWLEMGDFLESGLLDGVRFYFWFITDCGYDSLVALGKSLESLAQKLPHIIVKNFGRNQDWSPFDNDENLQKLISCCESRVIDFPDLGNNKLRNRIDAQALTFGEVLSSKKFQPSERQYIRAFLKRVYAELDELESLRVVHV